jgi:hypothetical protein
MPPNTAFACRYAERFVAVLHAYQRPVTAADRDSLTATLNRLTPRRREPCRAGLQTCFRA